MRNVKKKIIIIGLLILVMCLGIGFAAFSTTLKINGKAKVSPNASNFKVEFAKSVRSSSDYDRSDVEGVSTPNNLDSNPGEFTDATTFENASVTFTEDGQSIDYKFYIVNAGKYDAHITNINIGNKKCTPDNDTDLTLADSACDSINLSVILGNPDHQTTYTESTPIENHVLNKGDWEQIIVRITYPEGSQLPDGDLAVEWSFIEIYAATTSNFVPEEKNNNSWFYYEYGDSLYNDEKKQISIIMNYYATQQDDNLARTILSLNEDFEEKISIVTFNYKGQSIPTEHPKESKYYSLDKNYDHLEFDGEGNVIVFLTDESTITVIPDSLLDSPIRTITYIEGKSDNVTETPLLPTGIIQISSLDEGTPNLQIINYNGTINQFKTIEGYSDLRSGITIKCSDGTFIKE